MCLQNTQDFGLDLMQSQEKLFNTAVGLIFISADRKFIVLWLISWQNIKTQEIVGVDSLTFQGGLHKTQSFDSRLR